MANVRVILGVGGPGIEVEGNDLDDASKVVRQIRIGQIMGDLKLIQEEFVAATTPTTLTSEQAIANIQASMPGAQVIEPGPERAPQWQQTTQTAAQAPVAAQAAPAQPPQPPAQGATACVRCGGVMKYRDGTGRNGAWAGLFCGSGDQSHTVWQ